MTISGIANTTATTMTIAPTSPTMSTSPTGSTRSANSGAAGIASNFISLLQLPTTQLQNQDPTTPLHTNQFTRELVSFASVEQQTNMNSAS